MNGAQFARLMNAAPPTMTVPKASVVVETPIRAGTWICMRMGRWSLAHQRAEAYAEPSGIVGGSVMLRLKWSPSFPTGLYVPGRISKP